MRSGGLSVCPSVCLSVCLYIRLPEGRFYPLTIAFTGVYQHQRLLLRGKFFFSYTYNSLKKVEKVEWLRGGKSKPPLSDIQNSHNKRNVGNHLSPCRESAVYMFSTAPANLAFKTVGFDSKVLGLQNSDNYNIMWIRLLTF